MIELEEILKNTIAEETGLSLETAMNRFGHSTISSVIQKAMKKACEDSIDLCAEKAETRTEYYDNDDYAVLVNEDSILDVKNLIE